MKSVRIYPYRWIVLLALMLVIMASEMQWLALAPVSRAALAFYKDQIQPNSLIGPDLLTLIHLVLFVFFSIPASFVIGKLGLKHTMQISSLLLIVFGLLKGFFAQNFLLVIISQIGLSISHALILNSITVVSARWFPLRERGFATGLASLAQYLGLLLVMIISPQVVIHNPRIEGYGNGIASLLFWLGISTAIVALSALFLFKEKPPTPSSSEPFEMESFLESFTLLLHKKHMGGLIMVFGLLWGLFNVFIAKIDSIAAFIGVENSNGVLGLILLGGGLFGSIIIPGISDHIRKRKILFIGSTLGIFVCFLLFALYPTFNTTTALVGYLLAGVLGFFFLSVIPLGFQYAAELSAPVQEASSQGVLLLNGHFIGVIMLLFMNLQGGNFLSQVLIASVALLGAAFFGSLFIQESPIIITEDERLREAIEKEAVHQR